MKKILLTGCAAIMFSIAGIAQEKPSTDYNKDKVEQATDSAYHETDSTLNQGIQRTEQQLENQADETRQDINQGVERADEEVQEAGERVEEGAQKVGEETKEGVQKAGDEMEQGVEKAGQEMEQGVERAAGEIDSTKSGMTSSESGELQPFHDVEVMEDKEGPNGEVVYKFNNAFYYVDRDKDKKLVKIEESQLQDAKHKVIVKTGNQKVRKTKG